MERALSAARRVDESLASRVQEAERLSWTWATDGSLVFSGRLAPEDGALFLKALEVARERLWQAARDEEPAVRRCRIAVPRNRRGCGPVAG